MVDLKNVAITQCGGVLYCTYFGLTIPLKQPTGFTNVFIDTFQTLEYESFVKSNEKFSSVFFSRFFAFRVFHTISILSFARARAFNLCFSTARSFPHTNHGRKLFKLSEKQMMMKKNKKKEKVIRESKKKKKKHEAKIKLLDKTCITLKCKCYPDTNIHTYIYHTHIDTYLYTHSHTPRVWRKKTKQIFLFFAPYTSTSLFLQEFFNFPKRL